MVAGIAINTAHELGHKKEKHERWLARVALAHTFYGHFFIEHNRGHHVRVATPEDPASSRLGENIWGFLPAHDVGQPAQRLGLEKKRFAPASAAPVDAAQRRPQRLGDVGRALGRADGWSSASAIFPYLVDPGGRRHLAAGVGQLPRALRHAAPEARSRGRYERVNPSHSWNSNNIGTNVLLYHLQRHSDHHANPTRRYQALRDFPEAPVLPTGYAGMIVLTWVPAVWRRVMDKRVVAHYDGDVSRANIQPRKATHYLAAYPRPRARAAA